METTWLDIAKAFLSKDTNFWLITTLLLIAYIGISKAWGYICNLRNKDLDKNQKDGSECIKLVKKDYTYLIVIMLIVSTFLVSLSLYTNEDAMSLFSFASTIASIILSVIAIILTITSETKNASTKEKLEKSAEQIELTTQLLEKASKDINPGLLQEIGQTIAGLDASMKDAIEKIEKVMETSVETKKAVERTQAEGNLEMKGENIEFKSISEYINRYKKRGDKDA